jgi:hypothetical protein
MSEGTLMSDGSVQLSEATSEVPRAVVIAVVAAYESLLRVPTDSDELSDERFPWARCTAGGFELTARANETLHKTNPELFNPPE